MQNSIIKTEQLIVEGLEWNKYDSSGNLDH